MCRQLYLNYKVSCTLGPDWIPRVIQGGMFESRGCSWPRKEKKVFQKEQIEPDTDKNLTNDYCFEVNFKRKEKDSSNPEFENMTVPSADAPGHQCSSKAWAQDNWIQGRSKMNSIFYYQFQWRLLQKERKSMLRHGKWNQYTHGDGFNWNKEKVHWCINDKFPHFGIVFWGSINLRGYPQHCRKHSRWFSQEKW